MPAIYSAWSLLTGSSAFFLRPVSILVAYRFRTSQKRKTPHAWRLTHAICRTKSTAAPHHLDLFIPTKGCNSHVNMCTPMASTVRFNEVRACTEKFYKTARNGWTIGGCNNEVPLYIYYVSGCRVLVMNRFKVAICAIGYYSYGCTY